MDCQRCGQRKATVDTYVVIEATAEFWRLCQPCSDLIAWELEQAEIERISADPEGRVRLMEERMGRPLSPEERAECDAYLARPAKLPPFVRENPT